MSDKCSSFPAECTLSVVLSVCFAILYKNQKEEGIREVMIIIRTTTLLLFTQHLQNKVAKSFIFERGKRQRQIRKTETKQNGKLWAISNYNNVKSHSNKFTCMVSKLN